MYDFLSFALTHPSIVAKRLLKQKLSNEQKKQITLAVIDKIESECSIKKNILKKYYNEFYENYALVDHITNSLKNFENSGAFNPTFQSIIYALVRCFKPQHVVETGVANGVSSTILLTAINKNKMGTLNSIDLPVSFWENTPYRKFDKVKVKKEVGWLVPTDLRNRWKLTLGSSKEKLPKILNEIKECGIFLHDSEHSFDNMMFEFNTSWPYIPKKGMLLADDVDRNDAFENFVSLHKNDSVSIKIGQFGLLMKI